MHCVLFTQTVSVDPETGLQSSATFFFFFFFFLFFMLVLMLMLLSDLRSANC